MVFVFSFTPHSSLRTMTYYSHHWSQIKCNSWTCVCSWNSKLSLYNLVFVWLTIDSLTHMGQSTSRCCRRCRHFRRV